MMLKTIFHTVCVFYLKYGVGKMLSLTERSDEYSDIYKIQIYRINRSKFM